MEDANFLLLQYWEITEDNGSCFPDGVSLHLDRTKRDLYLGKKYTNRVVGCVPKTYERIIGESIVVTVGDSLFSHIEKYESFRLREHEFNNLVNIGHIDLI
jgi:hypothetical protein